MPLPLLGLLGLAAEAVPAIVRLFDDDDQSVASQAASVVSEVGRAVTGATSDDEAVAAIKANPALYAEFQATIKDKAIELYRAKTERLVTEQGRVDAETLAALPPEAAAQIALLRMTTRPKVVLRMSHVILLPIYVIGVDGALALFNIISRAAGSTVQLDMLGAQFFTAGSLYVDLYTWAAPTAASVIATYMGLREAGKAGKDPDHPLAKATKAATRLFGRLRSGGAS